MTASHTPVSCPVYTHMAIYGKFAICPTVRHSTLYVAPLRQIQLLVTTSTSQIATVPLIPTHLYFSLSVWGINIQLDLRVSN